MKFKVQCLLLLEGHCVKSAHIQSYPGLHFPAFGLNLIVFSPNVGKYGPEYLRIWALFTQ